MKILTNLSYKAKLISIYITTTVIGVILVLVAIFNASMELEILHKSENMHEIFSDYVSGIAAFVNQKPDAEMMTSIANDMTTKDYKVILVTDGAPVQSPVYPEECYRKIAKRLFKNNGANHEYGYVSNDGCTVNWALIPAGQSGHQFLILHKFPEHSFQSLYHAYVNRLIIPIAFFIWMMVWGSLILGNLVNKLKKQKEEVEHIALHDALTGLPNRNYFSDKMHEILSYSKRENKNFTLGVIDLNKFKKINDDLGHNYGDELLRQFAKRIKNKLREYDIVARVGGDEFILLLPDTDDITSKIILERIYSALIKDYTILGKCIKIGASIGVAYFPQHETDFMELLHKADCAMYAAKQGGGGIAVSDS